MTMHKKVAMTSGGRGLTLSVALVALLLTAPVASAHLRSAPDLYTSESAVHLAGWDWLMGSEAMVAWTFTAPAETPEPGTCRVKLEAMVPDAVDGGVGFGAPVTVVLSSRGVSVEAKAVLRDPFRTVIVPSDFRALGRRAVATVELPPEIEEAFAESGRLTVTLLPRDNSHRLAVKADSLRLEYVG